MPVDSDLALLFEIPGIVGSDSGPIIDLNGPSPGINATVSYTEGDGFAGDLSEATLTWDDGDSIASIIVTCEGAWGDDGADEAIAFDTWTTDAETDLDDTLVVGATTFRLVYVAATGVLTITNSEDDTFPIEDGQALIRLFEYSNSATPLTPGARNFSWEATSLGGTGGGGAPEADAFRIRRSSDSTEDDFTLTEVDDGTLDTFVGAGDGCVATWKDPSGNSNDVTQSTTTQQPKLAISGTVQDGVVFDGVNDSLNLGMRATSGPVGALSIAARIKTTSVGICTIASEWNITGNQRMWQVRVNAGKLQVVIAEDGAAANYKQYESTASVNTGSWLSVAFVFNAGNLKLYIDGAEASVTKSFDGAMTTIYNGSPVLYIGASSAGTLNIFDGSLDDIAVYQSALSGAEIAAIHSSGTYPSGALCLLRR